MGEANLRKDEITEIKANATMQAVQNAQLAQALALAPMLVNTFMLLDMGTDIRVIFSEHAKPDISPFPRGSFQMPLIAAEALITALGTVVTAMKERQNAPAVPDRPSSEALSS